MIILLVCATYSASLPDIAEIRTIPDIDNQSLIITVGDIQSLLVCATYSTSIPDIAETRIEYGL